MGVHICLRRKDRVIQEPGDVREGSSADLTAQPGSSQFGVSAVEIFNLHFRITSDWDWANGGEEKERKIDKEWKERKAITERLISFTFLCSSYPLPESQDHSSTSAPLYSPDIEPCPCPARAPW